MILHFFVALWLVPFPPTAPSLPPVSFNETFDVQTIHFETIRKKKNFGNRHEYKS